MKYLLLLILPILLLGCEAETKQVDKRYDLPPELSDCKIFQLNGSTGPTLYVVRCGDQITTALNPNPKNSQTRVQTTTISQKN